MAACWRELAQRPGTDSSLLVQWWSTPWAPELFSGLPDFRRLTKVVSENDVLIRQLGVDRAPDIVVISGWGFRWFRKLPFYPELRKCRFIMAMDNPWSGSWRQHLARSRVGAFKDRLDAVAVVGERCF